MTSTLINFFCESPLSHHKSFCAKVKEVADFNVEETVLSGMPRVKFALIPLPQILEQSNLASEVLLHPHGGYPAQQQETKLGEGYSNQPELAAYTPGTSQLPPYQPTACSPGECLHEYIVQYCLSSHFCLFVCCLSPFFVGQVGQVYCQVIKL